MARRATGRDVSVDFDDDFDDDARVHDPFDALRLMERVAR